MAFDVQVEVEWSQAPVPPPQPMAEWTLDGDTGLLRLPGLGEVRISGSGVVLCTPDAATSYALWDRVGAWVSAQVLQARGITVARGAVIGKDDHVVLLTGAPRSGASITAMIATRRGWGIVCDGYVPIDRDGEVVNTTDEVVLDAAASVGLPADHAVRALSTGSPRSAIRTNAHPGGRITHAVVLVPSQAVGSLSIERRTLEQLASEERFLGAFDRLLPGDAVLPHHLLAELGEARASAVIRPMRPRAYLGTEFLPPNLTMAVLDHVTAGDA